LAGSLGVATAAGILFAINLWLGLATMITWILIATFFRYSSLASLISALFSLFYYILLFGFRAMTLAVLVMSLLLVYRHRENVGKLLAGKESRLGSGKA
jgi:acyl phosphate:glycerol-3-phosphate acyltransferase